MKDTLLAFVLFSHTVTLYIEKQATVDALPPPYATRRRRWGATGGMKKSSNKAFNEISAHWKEPCLVPCHLFLKAGKSKANNNPYMGLILFSRGSVHACTIILYEFQTDL